MNINKINLRALELDDLEFLFEIENNRNFGKYPIQYYHSQNTILKNILWNRILIFFQKNSFVLL